ncbi:hypothetical protein [Ketogulonicigenium vulgare]|uniref:Uncharacterized protein n=1 Tax=Ketogulonicigenium vulgare (strain WSH-001) TaxID=759362 RepID=F9YAI7_KETVW|nr:hypothetical protein [Ketogulonicigenium vulgare]ADO43224.1 conserved hypothetical protein [Ketogulonicigenium vulgare Y25]AEM41518.1 hypothetical protein KVU_1679 [Ketogulonicigenium vulgare WSH-001]ALJ81643.1 hypothetical protein KVH_10960 [Ketogulonicigenium vulgare]ANW34314.1 hypothetical protein KvSKV_10875 [Ketogulonicigenium vulgare]AOZ55260.1 hypothetical protein KVC_2255 [Ketogulonicigenium vulgare]
MSGIGHNGGPGNGDGFLRHCWRMARRELIGGGGTLPIEVVRARVARAKALGLDYKTYAGVRATTGRDLVAFLYSSNALGVFRPGQVIADAPLLRLQASAAQPHLGLSGRALPGLLDQIAAKSELALPRFGTNWGEMRDDLKAWLMAQGLPGDAVLMIGETDHERELMTAGGLAGFISGQSFLGAGAGR